MSRGGGTHGSPPTFQSRHYQDGTESISVRAERAGGFGSSDRFCLELIDVSLLNQTPGTLSPPVVLRQPRIPSGAARLILFILHVGA